MAAPAGAGPTGGAAKPIVVAIPGTKINTQAIAVLTVVIFIISYTRYSN